MGCWSALAGTKGALLGKGMGYDQLPESYVIFLCDYDPYGVSTPACTIERCCRERPSQPVRDGSHWLVLNASAWRGEGTSGCAICYATS